MTGTVTNVFLKIAHGAPMQPVQTATADSGEGLDGDVHYGHDKRQVLLIERETLDEFDLSPGQVRENITVAGLPLAGTPPGTRLQVGAAVLEVTLDCAPCNFIEGIRPGLRAAIDGRRGTLCRVVAGGEIQVGAAVKVLEPAGAPIPDHHH